MSDLQPALPEETIEERRQREHDEHQQYLRDLQATLETPTGRRFVWTLLGASRLFLGSIESRDDSPTTIAFHEGKRAVGLMLLGDITRYFPLRYAQMVTEASGVSASDAGQ